MSEFMALLTEVHHEHMCNRAQQEAALSQDNLADEACDQYWWEDTDAE
jgi:hypothetical protein